MNFKTKSKTRPALPVTSPSPFKLLVMLFAESEGQPLLFMETARDELNEPNRWKLPQRDFLKPDQPLREAAFAMLNTTFGLDPSGLEFWNALPHPYEDHKGKHTITSAVAVACPTPHDELVRSGLREWFPANELLHRCQSYRQPFYTEVLSMLDALYPGLPKRSDH